MPIAEHFGNLITPDHKVLSEESESRNNHRYAVVVQDLATRWIQSYPCKSELSQETQKNLLKFLEPTRKPKVIYIDNSLEFGKSCEESYSNHCTSTPHRSETNHIAERAVRRVKEGTSAVLLQSGLGNEWWADSMECNNCLRNIQDVLSDGKTPYERRFGSYSVDPAVPVQDQNFSGDGKRVYEHFSSRLQSPKSFTLTIRRNLPILWRSVTESSNFNTSSIRDEWYCWESGTQSRRKERLRHCCNQVWTLNGGRIPWSATAVCEHMQDLLSDGKTPYERRFGIPFTRPVIPFGAMVEYHPISAKDQSRLHQFGAKVLPGVFFGIWKVNIMVADIEELEEMDASELQARRLNAKEVLTPQRSGNFMFPKSDGTLKIYGREQRLRTSTLTRERTEQGEEQEILQGRSEELDSPTQLQDDLSRDNEEAKNDFLSITGEFIHRHHVVLRVKLYVPKEESFPFPLQHIDVTRTSYTSLDVMLEKILKITGAWMEKKSDAWTGLARFVLMKERPPEGFSWSRRRLTRKQKTCRPDDVWPEMWKYMFYAAKKKAKPWWAIEKPELDNARQLRGIFFLEPNDEEFKLTVKAARRKLEVPMPAAMPCKIPIKSSRETHRSIGKRKTKYACVVDADESTRPRLEGAGHKPHQDHITAKGTKSMTHYSLVHKFIPMLQALKIPDAKAAMEKNVKHWRKFRHGSWRRSETRKKWSTKRGIRAEKFIFRH